MRNVVKSVLVFRASRLLAIIAFIAIHQNDVVVNITEAATGDVL